jgi:3alpha(or 20beta)-hydroxysteroid dehydrogenase
VGDFDGRVVLVTGGARGQGAEHCRAFAAEGGLVLIADVLDEPGEALARTIGEQARYRHLDVTDEAGWHSAVDYCEDELGPVGVLVNNAGINSRANIAAMQLADFEAVMRVNLTGAFLGIKTITPSLRRAGGGAIVNISSISGIGGAPESPAYSCSKWAIRGLTKCAALDLAGDGIRVNTVIPGLIDTTMVRPPEASYDALLERNLKNLLIPRIGSVVDVAAAVLFLAGDRSSYITGSELLVDGGWTTPVRRLAQK